MHNTVSLSFPSLLIPSSLPYLYSVLNIAFLKVLKLVQRPCPQVGVTVLSLPAVLERSCPQRLFRPVAMNNMLTPLFVWALLAIFVGALSEALAETTTVTVVEGTTTYVDSPSPTATQLCNGHASFCTRSYGNITYVGAHNSPFVKENNVASNQNLDVTQQLTAGIRMCELTYWLCTVAGYH